MHAIEIGVVGLHNFMLKVVRGALAYIVSEARLWTRTVYKCLILSKYNESHKPSIMFPETQRSEPNTLDFSPGPSASIRSSSLFQRANSKLAEAQVARARQLRISQA
jgi:hypothetical protein